MDIRLTTRGFDTFVNRNRKAPEIIRRHMTKAINVIVIAGEGIAKKLAPRDTSHLARSITHRVESLGGTVRGRWGTALSPHYGPDVEYGTRPHWPPVSALEGWARRHGANPYAVAAGIAKHGTKAQPFMRPSFQQVAPKAKSLLRAEFKLAVAEIKGG